MPLEQVLRMTGHLTQEEMNEAIRSFQPRKGAELIQLQARMYNPAVFHYESRDEPRTQVIETIIRESQVKIPQLTPTNQVGMAVRAYYTSTEPAASQRNLNRALEKCWESENARHEWIEYYGEAAYCAVRGSLDLWLRSIGSISRNGEPLKMKLKGHLQAEHPVHATQILLHLLPNAKPSYIIATLLHDFIEDYWFEVRDTKVPESVSIHAAHEAIISELSDYVEEQGHSCADVNQDLLVSANAIVRLTTDVVSDYWSNIFKITDCPDSELFISFDGADYPTTGGSHEAVMASVVGKICDKYSGISNWHPFVARKKFWTDGKAIWTLQMAGRYLTERFVGTQQERDEIAYLTGQFAMEMRRQNRDQVIAAQKMLKLRGEKKGSVRQQGLGRLPEMLNKEIDNGLLFYIDAAADIVDQTERFGKSVYGSFVVGSKLIPGQKISDILKLEGETDEQAIKRLSREKSKIMRELPAVRIDTDEEREEYLRAIKRCSLARQAEEWHKIQRYLRRCLAMERGASVFSLIPGFYFQRRERDAV